MPRPIKAVIDLAALSHNLGRVRAHLSQATDSASHQNTRIWAVIKANAYGHGIEAAVQAFAAADGLAMLDFEEAVRCRQAGWQGPILMLEGFFDETDLELCVQLQLWPVVHDADQIATLQSWAANGSNPLSSMRVFLKLDTGMHRLGFTPQTYTHAWTQLEALRTQGRLLGISHMTHFACADSDEGLAPALAVYTKVTEDLLADHCLANSAAIWRHAPQIVDGAVWQNATTSTTQMPTSATTTWVRPGICLYGASPFDDRRAQEDLRLLPAMTLESRVLQISTVAAGEGIGYGYKDRANQAMRIAVVACGYADGYPRHAPAGTPVGTSAGIASLIGRVSMDMLTVDITHLPNVQRGDPVILWGQDGPSVDEVAKLSGTIGYELLAGVTARVPRVVV
ncbi:alanine racemase [Orrella sp. 11846]|uniref:alanine racemase n=1 Tax=Orrella sp. 11846 TaxID=3409913 RepID=UPI003B5C636B